MRAADLPETHPRNNRSGRRPSDGLACVNVLPPPEGTPQTTETKSQGPTYERLHYCQGDGGGVGGTHPHKAAAAKVELSNGPFVQRKPRVQV